MQNKYLIVQRFAHQTQNNNFNVKTFSTAVGNSKTDTTYRDLAMGNIRENIITFFFNYVFFNYVYFNYTFCWCLMEYFPLLLSILEYFPLYYTSSINIYFTLNLSITENIYRRKHLSLNDIQGLIYTDSHHMSQCIRFILTTEGMWK